MRKCILNFTVAVFLLAASLYGSSNKQSWNFGSVSIKNDQLQVLNVTTHKRNFQKIEIKDLLSSGEPGMPEVPVKIYLIAAPKDGSVSANVSFSAGTKLENINLIPIQHPLPDGIYDKPNPDFVQNNEVFTKNAFYPDKDYEISEKMTVRGVAFFIVKVYPVKYNPVTKEVLYYKNVDFSYSVSGKFEIDRRLYSEDFHSAVFMNCLNGEDFFNIPTKNYSSPKDATQANYLIITRTSMTDAANKFAVWKNQMGFKTKVVFLENIGTTETQIISYIKNAYSNWTLPPEFVLLIGDAGDNSGNVIIPTGYHNNHPYHNSLTGTDLYYGCVDGNDYKPDITVGRLLCDNNTEALNQVNKIINYEKNPPTQSTFYSNILNAAYFQDNDPKDNYADRRFAQTTEEIRNYEISALGKSPIRVYYTPSTVTPLYWSTGYGNNGTVAIPNELKKPGFAWTGSRYDIKSAINNGVYLVTHRDHGGKGGWGDPTYNYSDINFLSNSNLTPVVYSINCMTGWFDNETDGGTSFSDDTYFAEKWMRHTNGGAVGYVAATRVSYSGQNDYFAQALVNGSTGYKWTNNINSFGDNFAGFNSGLFNNSGYRPAVAMNYAKMYALSKSTYGNNYNIILFEEFAYFGDPSMRMWHQQPAVIAISNLQSSTNAVTFSSSVTGLTATLTDAQGVVYGQITNGSGNYSIPVAQNGIGKQLFLTISKLGYKPYITSVTINNLTLLDPENPANTVNGLDYKYYHGTWDLLPNFNSLTPVQSGNISNYNISGASQTDNFGFVFTGYISVPADGAYTFYTNSDDGSKLFIGNTLVVNNDGIHPNVEQSGIVGLKAGKHAVRVEFFERGGGEVLEVRYEASGIVKQLIPGNALFRVQPVYSLTVTNGSGSGNYLPSVSVAISANENPSGKVFDKWVINSGTPTIANVSLAATTLIMPVNAVSITATYKDAVILREPENPANTVAGLNSKYYQGNWDLLPDFNALVAVNQGAANNFDISQAALGDYFGFVFNGYLNVPTDGFYKLYTRSDDGSKLYIGSELVVSNDGTHPTVEQSGQIGLKAGKHAVRLEYFEKTGGQVLEVLYEGSGIAKQLIPNSALFRVQTGILENISMTCDNSYELYLNGTLIGSGNNWTQAQNYANLALQYGKNVIAVKAMDTGGIAGFLAELKLNGQRIETNSSWKVSINAPAEWKNSSFNDASWANANEYGAYGVNPWGKNILGMPADSKSKWIWSSDAENHDIVYFRYVIQIGSTTNIALNKPSSQSSTVYGGESYRAVDNNTDGDYWNNSVTHTDLTATPWWKVDLGGSFSVNSVTLWNRTDACSERLSNFHVDYLNQSGTVITKQDYPGIAGNKTVINSYANGVYAVRVQLNGTNYLSLAEVEVIGIPSSNSSPTAISEEAISKQVELSQNYPNPFNPVTTISFALPNNGNVKLAVMNAKGETVKVLATGNYQAGNHSFDFDGSGLNSGVYFYQLTTPEKTITKKMILIK